MTALRALDPGPAVQRGDITICATAAARTELGLYVTVAALGDRVFAADPLALSLPTARREWAVQAAAATKLPIATVEAALLDLVPLVEVALRGRPEEPKWPEPVPFTSPALPRFPAEVFAPGLRDHVQSVVQAMQVPVDLPAMLALSVLSTACARRIAVRVRDGWREPVNVYTVTVLPSGERKTPTFTAMVGPLEEWERAGPDGRGAGVPRCTGEDPRAPRTPRPARLAPNATTRWPRRSGSTVSWPHTE